MPQGLSPLWVQIIQFGPNAVLAPVFNAINILDTGFVFLCMVLSK